MKQRKKKKIIVKNHSPKPSFEEILVCAIRATIKEEQKNDKLKTLHEIKKDNETFFERCLCNFMIISTRYYEQKEIKEWLSDYFNKFLPEI